MYFIGYDIGSSSVKASLLVANSKEVIASDFFPKEEMEIKAKEIGWAEQDPETWWDNLKLAHQSVIAQSGIDAKEIAAIGITWQMHGLVLVDKNMRVLRDAIIWCDSRAATYGRKAFEGLGEEKCLNQLLNSPGNFTVAKLAWVKENEPEVYKKIYKMMLPGDYIAMRLSGEIGITTEGLSEGILWNFKENKKAKMLLDYFDISEDLIPEIKPIFGEQGLVSKQVASELGFALETPITYRAGDQPNNAFSLQVMAPGEVAANAGTSGVVYGIADKMTFDSLSRVNSFAHVNYTESTPYIGVLLCINGTGILNSWLKRNLAQNNLSYNQMNEMAASSQVGAKGISIIPFGNGAERVLQDENVGCSIHGLNFNIHTQADIFRAAQEGIVFAYAYGLEVMREMELEINCIKAGYTNMFLSPIFAQTLADVSGAIIELYNTEGAAGAARGAGVGLGRYESYKDAFNELQKVKTYHPNPENENKIKAAYSCWKNRMNKILN